MVRPLSQILEGRIAMRIEACADRMTRWTTTLVARTPLAVSLSRAQPDADPSMLLQLPTTDGWIGDADLPAKKRGGL